LLLRGRAIAPHEVAPLLAEAAAAAAAAAGSGKAGAKAKAGKSAAAAGGAGSSLGSVALVQASDTRFSCALASLALLRGAYGRLDASGSGAAGPAAVRAAFEAEARSAEERTEPFITAWIGSRDINGDGALSWPEYAASFGHLLPPPLSGVTSEAQAQALLAAAGEAAVAAGGAGASSGAPVKGAKGAAQAAKGAKGAASGSAEDAWLRGSIPPEQTPEALAAALAACGQLGAARSLLEREAGCAARCGLAQLSGILHASLPPGQALEDTPQSLLALPWAKPVLTLLSGLGLMHLFCSRQQLRPLLLAWSSHLAALVAQPENSKLWIFSVSQPSSSAAPSPSASSTSSMVLSPEVLRLPGMLLLLQGCGYEAVFAPWALRGSAGAAEDAPVAFRLCGAASLEWQALPEAQRSCTSACAHALARHAVAYEAQEAANPAAVLLGIGELLSAGS